MKREIKWQLKMGSLLFKLTPKTTIKLKLPSGKFLKPF